MPVPVGAPPDSPEPLPGTFGLLLSWMLLFVHAVHDCVPSGPVSPGGHRPICGEGQSSLFCELLTRPVLLLSPSLWSPQGNPPAFVLDRHRALFSPWLSCMTWSHTCWQAPM